MTALEDEFEKFIDKWYKDRYISKKKLKEAILKIQDRHKNCKTLLEIHKAVIGEMDNLLRDLELNLE